VIWLSKIILALKADYKSRGFFEKGQAGGLRAVCNREGQGQGPVFNMGVRPHTPFTKGTQSQRQRTVMGR